MKKQATKKTTPVVRDLPVRDEKDVKGGSFSIGNVVGSVVKVPIQIATN